MADPPFPSQELFSGHGWRVTLEDVTLPDGSTKKTSRVHTFDTVHILALPTDRTVLVVHEYRPIWRTKIWQLPSGKADKEQDIVAAAQRELREETGYRANSIEPYYRCHHWDRVDYACNVFIARDLVKDALPKDDCESMDAHELPIIEAIQKVLQSPYIHTVSLATLLRYAREHGE